MKIKLVIDETGRSNPKEQSSLFNTVTEFFRNVEEAKAYLKERYGKNPKPRNATKVYVDGPDGKQVEIGFTRSYWTRDVSHDSKSWYQTDWISLYEVTEKPIII